MGPVIAFICVVASAAVVRAEIQMPTTSIPLQKNSLPASDLIYGPNGKLPLYPDQAMQLEQKSGVDLSKLDPDTSTDVYKGVSTLADSAKDNAIPISSGQLVNYTGTLETAAQAQYFMNVQVSQPNNQPPRTMTLLLSTDLHNYLLRKEMLRRLGYQIPGIKYLPQIRIQFPDGLTKLQVMSIYISNYTDVDQNRWVVDDKTDSALQVTLQDVFVIDTTAQATRYYNVAFGPPVTRDSSGTSFVPEDKRTMRAMALIEGLLSTPEDVNLMDWNACRIQNGSVLVAVNDVANFGCGLDDALWILRKIAVFSRDDLLQMARAAMYPEPIAEFMVEKLASRRDSLMKCFNLKDVKPLGFDAKKTIGTAVVKGKVMQPVFPGIASRFSGKDQETPIKGLGWYALSEVESNVLAGVFTKLDNDIPGLTIQNQTTKHENNVIQEAIDQYISTGQNQSVPVPRAIWAAPLLNGGVTLGRSIVIGNYLGTNNPVQLADSATEYLNVGMVIGIDNLPSGVGAQGLIQGTVSRSVTHLKPLTSLKKGVTEPFKHVLADLLFKSADNVFQNIDKIKKDTMTPDAINNQIAKDLEQLTEALGPGESLILTDSLNGVENASGSFGALSGLGPQISLTLGGNQIVLYRVQIYRKPPPYSNTIQVFRDDGELHGVNLTFEATLGVPIQMPILTVTAKKVAGAATSRIFEVNIDPGFSTTNPGIFTSAMELDSLFRTRSTEVLEAHQKPNIFSVKFHDSGSSLQFFHYMRRTLKEDGDITIKTPTEKPVKYISLLQGAQAGKSYQALATQVGTFIYQRLTNDTTISLNTQANPNPGRTFLGSSTTRDGSFQGQVSDTKIEYPFAQVQYRWDGWQMTTDDITKLTDSLSKKYDWALFAPNFLGTTQKVQLYELQLNINFYEAALQSLDKMSPANEQAMYKKYYALHQCATLPGNINLSKEDFDGCIALSKYDKAYRSYAKDSRSLTDLAKDDFAMAYNIEQFAPFKELVNIVGGAQNIYLYAVLSGYRVGTEVFSNPISSAGFGHSPDLYGDGVLTFEENRLDMNDGEFWVQYLRDFL
jgi:hypothetical protein